MNIIATWRSQTAAAGLCTRPPRRTHALRIVIAHLVLIGTGHSRRFAWHVRIEAIVYARPHATYDQEVTKSACFLTACA